MRMLLLVAAIIHIFAISRAIRVTGKHKAKSVVEIIQRESASTGPPSRFDVFASKAKTSLGTGRFQSKFKAAGHRPRRYSTLTVMQRAIMKIYQVETAN